MATIYNFKATASNGKEIDFAEPNANPETIAELDGKAVSDEVLKDIFSKFCVGK